MSEQDPFVVRTPNGVVFTYGNAAAARKIDVDAMASDPTAECRRVDRLPDPEKLTVGEMIDISTFLARTPTDWRLIPWANDLLIRRELLLSASPGWKAFVDWKDVEYHRMTPLEGAKELLAMLVDRLKRPSEELRLMSLAAAIQLLRQPEPASPTAPPQGHVKTGENGEDEDPPTPEMWKAYWAAENGINQNTIGVELGVSQPTIHRYIKRAKEWIAAGHTPPGIKDLPTPTPRRRAFSVDPRKMGRSTEDDTIDPEDDE